MAMMRSRAAATRRKRSAARLAQRRLGQGVQRRQEPGPVGLRQRWRPAAAGADLAKVPRYFPAGQCCANVVRRPNMASMGQGPGTLRQAPRGERNVGGDADIRGPDTLGDPIVGLVGPAADGDHLDIRQTRRADRPRSVRNDAHQKVEPSGDTKRLLPHRAGVGVDIERDHARPRASPAPVARSRP